jgi:hypothetical protein
VLWGHPAPKGDTLIRYGAHAFVWIGEWTPEAEGAAIAGSAPEFDTVETYHPDELPEIIDWALELSLRVGGFETRRVGTVIKSNSAHFPIGLELEDVSTPHPRRGARLSHTARYPRCTRAELGGAPRAG